MTNRLRLPFHVAAGVLMVLPLLSCSLRPSTNIGGGGAVAPTPPAVPSSVAPSTGDDNTLTGLLNAVASIRTAIEANAALLQKQATAGRDVNESDPWLVRGMAGGYVAAVLLIVGLLKAVVTRGRATRIVMGAVEDNHASAVKRHVKSRASGAVAEYIDRVKARLGG